MLIPIVQYFIVQLVFHQAIDFIKQSSMTTLNQRIGNKSISSREKEVLLLLAYGDTSNTIAKKLFISHHTVMSHRKNLLEKLDEHNVAGMIRRAFEVQLLLIEKESDLTIAYPAAEFA